MFDVKYHEMPDGRRIAYRHIRGSGPTLVFLPGYMSDMDGGKATALFDWAREQGRACLLLDYSGCGKSEGEFADGTLSKWRDEVLALIEAKVEGEVVVIGSSMGGWLMLLVGAALGDRLAGMVGIAAAPDFTEWGYSDEQKAQMAAGETVFEDNPYGPEPTPTHAGFFADGQAQRQMGGIVPIDAPARLLHGHRDEDVPWQLSLQIAGVLRSDAVQVTFVKDGDHRLSRPQDIALLLRTVDGLIHDLEHT
ncbi:alpha/beta fold hydrolase [Qipengyuania sp. 1NDH17]|uniref:Palmitoyl-protein thioesterase ABHD10, mitochondrial n=1 Tax=Qipengyuania polymorpha TaxID=2867234 RepID=A0ABS7IYY5_9SPHN|nr:alpha/beta hydrolase [Qipengyuania polymorpha]MBX7458623.1 alpha/beta fold hydrolase [Qipengyuania polymorpha]